MRRERFEPSSASHSEKTASSATKTSRRSKGLPPSCPCLPNPELGLALGRLGAQAGERLLHETTMAQLQGGFSDVGARQRRLCVRLRPNGKPGHRTQGRPQVPTREV